jgi:hypothetical protein
MNFLRCCFTFSAILISLQSFAQTSTIRGSVYDKDNGEPIIYCNVILIGTGKGAATDLNGFFEIPNVKPGYYKLFCTYLGYDSVTVFVTLKTNQILTQKFSLKKSSVNLSTVNISAQQQQQKTETNVDVQQISAREINLLPSVGGAPDLAQYLQVLPGVISSGDVGGDLFIQGGTPIQNLVQLDGMTIYNPFHSIGLFSVFETDIIKNVDVYGGGFNASYGGRTSSVIDITTRDGDKNNIAGEVSAGPFEAKALLEGPLRKPTDSTGSISFILAAKTCYLNETSKGLYPYADSSGLPYSFSDLYGKISVNGLNGSKLTFSGFDFNDNASYQNIENYHWNEYGGAATFVIVPGATKTVIDGGLNYSNYNISLQIPGLTPGELSTDTMPRTSSVGGFEMYLNFNYYIPNGYVKYGFDIGAYKTTLDFFNTVGLETTEDQNSTDVSGFIVFHKILGPFIIEPSFRLQYYASLPAMSPEPRLSVKWLATNRLRFKVAGGVYSQNFISTKSDEDIVDLFTGFLTAPNEDILGTNGQVATSNLQRAYHIVGGAEYDITEHLNLDIEPYIKFFVNTIFLNENKVLPTDPDFVMQDGQATGLDFVLKYDYNDYFFWLTYSLGYIYYNNGQQVYPAYYDRRDDINLVLSRDFGKHKSWQLSAHFTFGTGFPFTQTQGFYENFNFINGFNTNPVTNNGQLGIIYDSIINGGRLPYYARLDVSAKKTWKLSKATNLEADFSIFNVLDRSNIFYFNRITGQRVNQLPILPSISLTLSF